MLLVILVLYVIFSSFFRLNVRIGWLEIGNFVSAVLKSYTITTTITTTTTGKSSDKIEIVAHFHLDKIYTEINGIDRCYMRLMGHLLNWMVMEWQKIHNRR